eukprot:15326079-Ditylum_brightwellii.AAC.1
MITGWHQDFTLASSRYMGAVPGIFLPTLFSMSTSEITAPPHWDNLAQHYLIKYYIVKYDDDKGCYLLLPPLPDKWKIPSTDKDTSVSLPSASKEPVPL